MKKRKARRIVGAQKLAAQSSNSAGFGYQIPPDIENVAIYFSQKGHVKIATNFIQYFQNCGWQTPTGAPIRNWKVAATDWIYDHCQSLKLAQRKSENII